MKQGTLARKTYIVSLIRALIMLTQQAGQIERILNSLIVEIIIHPLYYTVQLEADPVFWNTYMYWVGVGGWGSSLSETR